MRKSKAIKILQTQKAKVLDVNTYNDETWVFQTGSFIKDFFGEDSAEYSFISQFTFMVKVPNLTSTEEDRERLKSKKEKAVNFIDDCIETIRYKGATIKKLTFFIVLVQQN